MLDPKVTGCLTVSTEYATRRMKSQQGIGNECLCLPSALSAAGPEVNSSGRTSSATSVILTWLFRKLGSSFVVSNGPLI